MVNPWTLSPLWDELSLVSPWHLSSRLESVCFFYSSYSCIWNRPMICSCRSQHDKYNTWDILIHRTLVVLDYPLTEDTLPSFDCSSLGFMFTAHNFGGHKVFNERTRSLTENKKTVVRSSPTILFLMTFPINPNRTDPLCLCLYLLSL